MSCPGAFSLPGRAGLCLALGILIPPFVHASTAAGIQRELWSAEMPEAIQGNLAAMDGCVFVALADGTLRALKLEDGSEKWRKVTGGDVEAGLVVWGGAVVMADAWGRLRAFSSKTGESLWDSRLQSRAISIGAGGNAVCVGEAGACSAFGLKQGGSLWRFPTGGEVQTPPWVGDDAAIFGSADHHVYFLDVRTGKEKKSVILSGEVFGGPAGESAAARRPAVVVGTHDGKLHMILRSGEKVWTVRTRGIVRAVPLLLPEVVVIGTDEGMLYSVARDSGTVKWSAALGGAVVDRLVSLGDTVAVGAGGTLNFVQLKTGEVLAAIPVGGVVRSVAGFSGRVVAATSLRRLVAAGIRVEAAKAGEKAPVGLVSLVVEPRRVNARKGEVVSVSFSLLDERSLTVDVADQGGRRVKLLDNRDKAWPRTYQYEWDGRDGKGKVVASGIYRLRVVSGPEEFNVGVEVLGRR